MSAQPVTTPTEVDLGRALGALFRAYLKAATTVVDELPGGPRAFQVLSTAAAGACRNQAGIAESLGIDRTVMTYLLDDLEQAGLIKRRPDPADRRSRQVVLTAKGERTRARLSEQLAAAEEHLLAGLADDDRAALRRLLSLAADGLTDRPGAGSACSIADELTQC